jgi:hypothetical protein
VSNNVTKNAYDELESLGASADIPALPGRDWVKQQNTCQKSDVPPEIQIRNIPGYNSEALPLKPAC